MKVHDELPLDETLSLQQAANYLHLGRDATRALFEAGELPGVSLNQKHLVFRRATCDAFLARLEAEQTKARSLAYRAHRTDAANDSEPLKRRKSRRLPNLDHYDSA